MFHYLFVFLLLLPLRVQNTASKVRLAVYLIGVLLYFITWIPLIWMPDSLWSRSAVGMPAPRLTPLLPFLGIALIGHSMPYTVLAALFIILHAWHGIRQLTS